ncbi:MULTISPECIES: N-acetylmuramoyl-L-alanine amidase [unclassified Bacillus cereus group]|uniref:N-acetylmuramoyl-L-alanine amidase n=1 Tax=unclassified Bacillus cereus group TaxID=2750818 RepID=UPI001F57EC9F|nr:MULTISPECIES: N-acetylmuramoyl-L-alanine amidase [unclassified Bacillus cereus group]
MNYRKVVAGILTAAVLSCPTSSLAAGKSFPDVPNWAQDSVNYLVEKNVLDGKPDGTFAPIEEIDRGSAAKLLASVLGLDVNKEAKPSFTDAQNHWAAPYIAAVEKAGVIVGDENGKFNPTGKINRASMATMLVKAYALEGRIIGEIPNQFDDIKDHWGRKNVNILAALEMSKGKGNVWDPEGQVTRAEAVQLIAQTDMRKENTSKRMYMDRPFITYHQPSLSSGITSNQHKPQIIEVKEQRKDGWMKIATSTGDKWTPLHEKTEYIGESFTTYQEASHNSTVLGKYEPQTVTVMEENGNWIRIRTYAGFQWVDKNQLNPPKQANFLEGKAIIIDPGHGDPDPGKDSLYMEESKIVLDTSRRVKTLFEKKTPLTVLLTREGDARPGSSAADSLKKRVEFAQRNKGDIFVSIHGNAYNGQAHGTETFYYNSKTKRTNPHVDESYMLAQKIQKRLVAALGTRDRGVQHKDLYVTRENTMPAVLTELAFVDNKIEGEKLAQPEWRQRAAEAIYAGILDYYEWKGNDVSAYR